MRGSKASVTVTRYWLLPISDPGGEYRHCFISTSTRSRGKNIHCGLLAIPLEGTRNTERHLRRQIDKLHLLHMVEKYAPLDLASSTGNIPPNDNFFHGSQRLREPVPDLLQRDGFGDDYPERFSMDELGTCLRGNFEVEIPRNPSEPG